MCTWWFAWIHFHTSSFGLSGCTGFCEEFIWLPCRFSSWTLLLQVNQSSAARPLHARPLSNRTAYQEVGIGGGGDPWGLTRSNPFARRLWRCWVVQAEVKRFANKQMRCDSRWDWLLEAGASPVQPVDAIYLLFVTEYIMRGKEWQDQFINTFHTMGWFSIDAQCKLVAFWRAFCIRSLE